MPKSQHILKEIILKIPTPSKALHHQIKWRESSAMLSKLTHPYLFFVFR